MFWLELFLIGLGACYCIYKVFDDHFGFEVHPVIYILTTFLTVFVLYGIFYLFPKIYKLFSFGFAAFMGVGAGSAAWEVSEADLLWTIFWGVLTFGFIMLLQIGTYEDATRETEDDDNVVIS